MGSWHAFAVPERSAWPSRPMTSGVGCPRRSGGRCSARRVGTARGSRRRPLQPRWRSAPL